MNKHLRELIFHTPMSDLINLLPPKDVLLNAACGEESAELFFSEDPKEIKQAREICMACPVRQICLDHHMVVENDGIAGGLTASERRKARVGVSTYSAEDINFAIQVRRDMVRLTAEQFSKEYEITQRTYYRWKDEFERHGMAS